MTKAEKFKEVFGVEHTEISKDFWDDRYGQYCPNDCYECRYDCGKPYVPCSYCKHLGECLSNGEAIIEKYNGRELIHKHYVGLCKMQIEIQNMTKVDECETFPQPVKEFLHNPRYTYAFCQCPVPCDKVIVIDKWKTKKINGTYKFHCTKCGLYGEISE